MVTNAQLYHSLIENRVHTFEPDRRGQDFYCRECSLPASAEIHNVFPVEGKQFKSLTEAQETCQGFDKNGDRCEEEVEGTELCLSCEQLEEARIREQERIEEILNRSQYSHLRYEN